MLSVTTESGNRLKTTKSHVDLINELATEVYGEDNCNILKSAVFDLALLYPIFKRQSYKPMQKYNTIIASDLYL